MFETMVDVPDGTSREKIVAQAKEEIHIMDTKGHNGIRHPVLFKEGTMKITRVSSMQPTEDLHGNIN